MSLECILCPQGPVYFHRVQLMFPEYSLCLWSTFYDLKVQFLAPENSLCP